MSEVRITVNDLRKAGHCASGVKAFFTGHGVSMRKLVQEGLTLDDVSHIEDANLDRVIEIAQERTAQEDENV